MRSNLSGFRDEQLPVFAFPMVSERHSATVFLCGLTA